MRGKTSVESICPGCGKTWMVKASYLAKYPNVE